MLKNPNYSTINVAYSYYNVANTCDLQDLMNHALHIAKDKGYDVFNCLDVQENKPLLEALKFGVGDGSLHYYLYNWRVEKMGPE